MSTTLSFSPFHSDPVSIPSNSNSNSNNTMNDNNTDEEQTYKEMIKQLAAQAPEPYGAIPPLLKKKKKKKKQKERGGDGKDRESRKNSKKVPFRRMSHVENWVAVDSKESIPDDEDLRYSSPFRNFLSTDFLVLPLHMPPPSLSATTESPPPSPPPVPKRKSSLLSKSTSSDLRPIAYPIKDSPIQVIDIDDEDEEEEESDFGIEADEEDDEETEIEEEEEEDDASILSNKRSIPSFSKSQTPSTSTTKSYAMSSSPPDSTLESTRSRWLETIAQLRKSLTRSFSDTNDDDSTDQEKVLVAERRKKSQKNLIPMPLPPTRKNIRKRRSEATTQPRFNPETNTYTRDTRSNPDHLRMISAELNMMRSRKLSSPLKPRGFLPRRTDAFIRGDQRKLSLLHNELLFDS